MKLFSLRALLSGFITGVFLMILLLGSVLYAVTPGIPGESGVPLQGYIRTLISNILHSPGKANNASELDGVPAANYQRVIYGSCPTGQWAIGVNADGSIKCDGMTASNIACNGSLPANSATEGASDYPPHLGSINWSYYNDNTGNAYCKFACNNGYYWNGTTCSTASTLTIGSTIWSLEAPNNPNYAYATSWCADYSGKGSNQFRMPTQAEVDAARGINPGAFTMIGYWTSSPGPVNPGGAYAGWRGVPHNNWADCFPAGNFCMGSPNTNGSSTVRCIKN